MTNLLQRQLLDVIRNNNFAEVDALLAQGASLHEICIDQDGIRNFAVHYVSSPEMVAWLHAKDPTINWDEKDGDGYTALATAAVLGEPEMVRALHRVGASLNAQNPMGETPLHVALQIRQNDSALQTVVTLLELGADPNIPNELGNTPLMKCAHLSDVQDSHTILLHLLGHAADAEHANEFGENALHGALEDPDVSNATISLLIRAGADPYQEDQYGFTPSTVAAEAGVRDFVLDTLDSWKERIPNQPIHFEGITKEQLFAPDENDWCMLDNPRVWRAFDQLEATLAQQGEHLTLEDMQQTNQQGTPWYAVATSFYQLQPLCKHLIANGEELPLPHGGWRTEEQGGFASTLFQTQQTSALFAEECWRGKPVAQLIASLNALPENLRDQIPNAYALVHRVRRAEQALQQGRS